MLVLMFLQDGTFMALGIEDGELKFDFNLGGDSFGNVEPRRRRSAMQTKLNDNQWHSYSLRLNNDVLEVVVDDEVVFKKELSAKAIASLKKGILIANNVKILADYHWLFDQSNCVFYCSYYIMPCHIA